MAGKGTIVLALFIGFTGGVVVKHMIDKAASMSNTATTTTLTAQPEPSPEIVLKQYADTNIIPAIERTITMSIDRSIARIMPDINEVVRTAISSAPVSQTLSVPVHVPEQKWHIQLGDDGSMKSVEKVLGPVPIM